MDKTISDKVMQYATELYKQYRETQENISPVTPMTNDSAGMLEWTAYYSYVQGVTDQLDVSHDEWIQLHQAIHDRWIKDKYSF